MAMANTVSNELAEYVIITSYKGIEDDDMMIKAQTGEVYISLYLSLSHL
jgi:hypothetical protein